MITFASYKLINLINLDNKTLVGWDINQKRGHRMGTWVQKGEPRSQALFELKSKTKCM